MQQQRKRIFVQGIVQGVGFRPFLHALAAKNHLTGFVLNQSNGVSVEIQGEPTEIQAFLNTLHTAPPPLAVIDSVQVEPLPPIIETAFRILQSVSQTNSSTPISPDIAVCDDCLSELYNPHDRRFRYPFINCTNCGPRFTIIRDIPYDRPNTTMSAFQMCTHCAAEYHSPNNRRFHAQPNACKDCGPKIWLQSGATIVAEGDDALQSAQAALRQGQIVAIKGIGGFHLAVDATNESAVARLRERKGRRDKPFALLARDLTVILRYAHLEEQDRTILQNRQRPIVLVRRKHSHALAPSVAPGNPLLGFMLPYSPLHHLLIAETPLVMTSGNLSEEPIAWRNDEALSRLAPIADLFLLHNRDIHVPCDDSVVTGFAGAELPIRRSRGYSPMPVKLSVQQRPMTLAVGAELKSCFCLTRDSYAYLSQHIGDMENIETLEAFERALQHMQALFRCQHPERVISDSHPGYLSTQWAQKYAREHNIPLSEIQHHHAHALSLMAEHAIPEDATVVTFAFDGTGYGTDGAIWGGEVLLARYNGFQRYAHLKYVPLPGGDSAIRHPARVALAHLFAAGIDWTPDLPCVQACTPTELRILLQQLATGIRCIPTSSMGRLFDAVAALLGVRSTVSYEGQAAIELEALCSQAADPYPLHFSSSQFDVAPMWLAILEDLRSHSRPTVIAARFHHTIANVVLHYSLRARSELGLETIGLTGGVFQNVYLLKITVDALTRNGFRVLTHRIVPPNDGGIALGQAVIAVIP